MLQSFANTACHVQIAEALKLLGAGPAAEIELRRIERQGKRGREPDLPGAAAAAAGPNKQIKLDPRLANRQAESAQVHMPAMYTGCSQESA